MEEKELAVSLLQQCFDLNKSVNYVVKQDERRKDRIAHLMRYSYTICSAFGEAIVAEDRSACALILLPRKKKNNLFSVRQDVQLIMKSFGVAAIPKVLRRESLIRSHHPKDDFCYLWFIGVAPSLQKQGKGTLLLNRIIEKYDALGLDIYLETSTVSNLPWYEKMGFHTYHELDFGFPLYMMRRTCRNSCY